MAPITRAEPGTRTSPERRRPRAGAPIQIGLLGCGTVGGGVLRLLESNARYFAERVGVPLEIKRVLVRDLDKVRVRECDARRLTGCAADVLDDPDIELVVEVMGGEREARALIEMAIARGKGVVTANKLLLARHGPALLDQAVARRVDLAFEGAVGGGIPIVRTLREALVGDWVQALTGIVNGTCNYVLTRMCDDALAFDDALLEAQQRGYAEADPSLDVDGHDAAHKLVVLAMLAFGARVDASQVPVEGIRDVEPVDLAFADRFGFVVKHLAIGRDHDEQIELRVHPTLIPKNSVMANVRGVLNAIVVDGRALGPCLLSGRGAGDMPTAVSVVADILDVARSIVAGAAGLSTRGIVMEPRPLRAMAEIVARYYLRLSVLDRPGVMARLAGALGDAGVSIEQIVQHALPEAEGTPVDVVMITHRAVEGQVRRALEAIASEPFLYRPARLIRIEDV